MSGTPASCAARAWPARSPVVPTYEGSPRITPQAAGCEASASLTVCTATAPGSPEDGSISGRTHTGRRPAMTRPRSSDLCSVRVMITSWPGWPRARQNDWLPWVDPATEKRHQSAPHSAAARASASASRRSACLIVSSPPYSGASPAMTAPVRSWRCLWPGVVIGFSRPAWARPVQFSHAASRGASAASPSGSRGSAGTFGRDGSGVVVVTGLVSAIRRSDPRPGRMPRYGVGVGSAVGEAAGSVGLAVGEAAGSVGLAVWEAAGSLGMAIGEAAGSPWILYSGCQGDPDGLLVSDCGEVPWLAHLASYGSP